MKSLVVFNEDYLTQIQNRLEPTLASLLDRVTFWGAPNTAQVNLNDIIKCFKSEQCMIDKEAPLHLLTLKELLFLLLENLNQLQSQADIEKILEFIKDVLHADPQSKVTLLSKIKNIQDNASSAQSAYHYMQASAKLALVGAMAAVAYYYARLALGCLAALELVAIVMPLTVGFVLILALSVVSFGITTLIAGVKLLNSGVDEIVQTYSARNASEEYQDVMQRQSEIIEAINLRLNQPKCEPVVRPILQS